MGLRGQNDDILRSIRCIITVITQTISPQTHMNPVGGDGIPRFRGGFISNVVGFARMSFVASYVDTQKFTWSLLWS